MRLAAGLAVAFAAALITFLDSPLLLEAWLLAFLLWTGLACGALGALAMGHLLQESWLAPVRAPLDAAARTLPLAVLMGAPVLVGLDLLYPWAGSSPPAMPASRAAWLSPWPFRLRAGAILLLLAVVAYLLTRPGRPDKRFAALTVALLVPSVTIAAQDWSLSRDPSWWGSLQGFAVWVEGITAALAAAALIALARGRMPRGETAEGEALERALLALGLTALWLWFTQFIVVWMADLPAEAGWYLRRVEDHWGIIKLALAVPALLLALALAAPPRHRRWRMATVCVLLLASHALHLWWVVRPDAPLALPPAWLDAAVAAALGLAWAAWWTEEMRRVDVALRHRGPHAAASLSG
ncbi:hypothetical protein [Falsiroseomonas oryzae]|uniref:hypothetical protein n=1 Tax=Falsiroseomonas oryzae TaxID=2766473 RepID=UPI0022EA8E27|nr:hypothetical protein [Roseomonas sp. MO-31]